MEFRKIARQEISKLTEIKRYESIERTYFVENGTLCEKQKNYIMNWSNTRYQEAIEELTDLYDRNGTLYGAFDSDKLVGIALLESKFIGARNDQLQLTMLQVSCEYRRKGIGEKLMKLINAY